jgi:hypothetical protein
MTDFTQQYSGFRYANTHRGDSMQMIAFRELGDANDWAKLVWFNDLIAPFITDDPLIAGDRVLLGGDPVKIPTTVSELAQADTSADSVLLTDVRLTKGKLTVDASTGDIASVSGRDNLSQAVANRIVTDPGELIYHPTYGCKIQRRRGLKNNAVTLLLGRMDIQDALQQETRLKRIDKIVTTASGDVLAADVDVTPIVGDSVFVKASV